MKSFDCDLHFHGLYAGGVSKFMTIPVIAEQAKLKGLSVVSTADITHAKWFEHVKENLVEEENGVFSDKAGKTHFVVGTEVEDSKRVHHLIFLPDFSSAQTFREKVARFGVLDCVMCGRPKLRLSAETIAEIADGCGGIFGPAHSFTPYTGIYAHFDSLKQAYGQMHEKLSFIELGLSADSYFADLIQENHGYAFLTASDSHSPWPYRIGREFTRMKLKKPCFGEIKKALASRDEGLIELNVGLDPREGKYHATACNACFARFSAEDAKRFDWKCPKCRGQIKKGVKDRILELASFSQEIHPEFRPEYFHAIPLAEIVQLALGAKDVKAKEVQGLWLEMVERLGPETGILVDEPIVSISEINESVAKKVESFRNGWVHYIPGGGGNYGKPIICDSREEFETKKLELERQEKGFGMKGQKTLKEFE